MRDDEDPIGVLELREQLRSEPAVVDRAGVGQRRSHAALREERQRRDDHDARLAHRRRPTREHNQQKRRKANHAARSIEGERLRDPGRRAVEGRSPSIAASPNGEHKTKTRGTPPK